ncbi:MAG: hypothetical protein WBC51_07175 [Vicinamibacterales bacterium]
MLKHIRPAPPSVVTEQWQQLQNDVEVELSSEDPENPIEGALLAEGSGGWRAGGPGRQTITLTWPAPMAIRRIRLVFEEHSQARTQEFVVRASTADGQREIVRQQFTFSPPGTTVEREEYTTNLDGVSQLELALIPAIDGGNAVATLSPERHCGLVTCRTQPVLPVP